MTLLTIKQLTERWSCSNKMLAVQRMRGKGPKFIKLGDGKNSPVRYPLDAVEQFENDRLRSSTKEIGAIQ